MSEMFNNYPQPEDYIPNNRHIKCPEFKLDIMTGETSKHTFEIPFDVNTDCIDVEVIYKLGVKPVVIKNSYSLEILSDEEKHTSTITCTLNADETKLFADTLLNTRVQIKFYMNDSSIMFSDIYRVKVVDSLENNRKAPSEGKMVYGTNYGYTED